MRVTRFTRLQKTRQFLQRLALDAQRHQNRAELQIGDFMGQHCREQRACVVAVEIARGIFAAADFLDDAGEFCRLHGPFRPATAK